LTDRPNKLDYVLALLAAVVMLVLLVYAAVR